jgi:hypothetical protein
VVPGSAGGSMAGVALKPLTVGFHEAGFAATLNQENRQPFWFQLSDKERQQVGSPWGPQDPQALNRYSYVLNNPLRWTDPSGHATHTYTVDANTTNNLGQTEVDRLVSQTGSLLARLWIDSGTIVLALGLVGLVATPVVAAGAIFVAGTALNQILHDVQTMSGLSL